MKELRKNYKNHKRHQMFFTYRDLLKIHYIVCVSLSMTSAAVTLVSRSALHCQHSNRRNTSASLIQVCLSNRSLHPNANFMCFHINRGYFRTSCIWSPSRFHSETFLYCTAFSPELLIRIMWHKMNRTFRS